MESIRRLKIEVEDKELEDLIGIYIYVRFSRKKIRICFNGFCILKKCIYGNVFVSLNYAPIDLKFLAVCSQNMFPGYSFGVIIKLSFK